MGEYEAKHIGGPGAGTRWFGKVNAFPRVHLRGRVTFWQTDGEKNSAPFPSALICMGADVDGFAAGFGALGELVHV